MLVRKLPLECFPENGMEEFVLCQKRMNVISKWNSFSYKEFPKEVAGFCATSLKFHDPLIVWVLTFQTVYDPNLFVDLKLVFYGI